MADQPVIQLPPEVQGAKPPEAPPAPSQQSAGPRAPGAAPRPSETPSRASARGIPAGPAALAATNAVAVTGASVYGAYGPSVAAAAAVGVALAAAALGAKKAKDTKHNQAVRDARKMAKENGAAWSPHRSGKFTGGSGGGSGSGGPRSTRGRGGSHGSAGGRTGSPLNGSGKGKHRGPKKPGPHNPRHPGSARIRSGSGASGPAGSGGNTGSGSGSDRRTRIPNQRTSLGSGPGRTSLLRKVWGPRPGGPDRPAGGLVRRSDGSRRQPLKAVGRGLVRAKDRAVRIGKGLVQAGRAVRSAWNSPAGRVARKWTLGALKRAWEIGWPALAAGTRGLIALIRRQGWRGMIDAIKNTWRAKRDKILNKNNPNTNAPGVPAATVNIPANLVGGPALKGAPTGGGQNMSTIQARFIQAAAEMLGAAMVYRPDGMMQVGNDFAQMPEAFRNVANAMKSMAQTADDEWPLHPTIKDLMSQVYQQLQQAATLSEQFAPAFRSLHAVDIQRIEAPRRGELMWDVQANPTP